MSLASIVCVPIFILGVSYAPASSSAAVLSAELDLGSVSAPVTPGQGGQNTGLASKAAKKAQAKKAQAWRASWLALRANRRGFSQRQQVVPRVGRPNGRGFSQSQRGAPRVRRPGGGYKDDRRIFGGGGGGVLPPVSPEPISQFMP